MTIIALIYVLVGAILGIAIGWFMALGRKNINSNSEAMLQPLVDSLRQDKLLLQQQFQQVQIKLTELEKEKSGLEAKGATLEERVKSLQKEMLTQFENLASKIFDDKGKVFRTESERNIQQLLQPLREKLVDFQQKVEDTYQIEARERHALKLELQKMIDTGAKLGEEANNLTRALKGDVKAQGNWGEVMLERILQASGLRDGEEYITQGRGLNLENDEGKALRPDVLINLPDDKHLVVDSKVSLVAYERLCACENKDDREVHSKEFLRSIRAHVDGLAGKKYHLHEKLASPEFTLLFFPIEGALSVALTYDHELFQYAWDKSIVIVGPTTILSTLKTVAGLWKQERQNKNALQIATEAGKLYDKFIALAEDWQKVGDSISRSQELYLGSLNKLRDGRGNLIARVEKIRLLGAKTTRTMPVELNSEENLVE
jgi:DNA recombination protein RmuC